MLLPNPFPPHKAFLISICGRAEPDRHNYNDFSYSFHFIILVGFVNCFLTVRNAVRNAPGSRKIEIVIRVFTSRGYRNRLVKLVFMTFSLSYPDSIETGRAIECKA